MLGERVCVYVIFEPLSALKYVMYTAIRPRNGMVEIWEEGFLKPGKVSFSGFCSSRYKVICFKNDF